MPWLGRDAGSCTASRRPLPGVVTERLQKFAAMNSFKKVARKVVAGLMSQEQVAGLVAQFQMLDADGDGCLTLQVGGGWGVCGGVRLGCGVVGF